MEVSASAGVFLVYTCITHLWMWTTWTLWLFAREEEVDPRSSPAGRERARHELQPLQPLWQMLFTIELDLYVYPDITRYSVILAHVCNREDQM
jgi:hypothetical protein